MNKKNNLYIVLFGTDRYDPEAHLRACKHAFDFLKDARKYASGYTNASIFKFHFCADSGDVDYFQEVL